MYRIWFVNFGYYSANESDTFEKIRSFARQAGFEARIEKDGKPVAVYSPEFGLRILVENP